MAPRRETDLYEPIASFLRRRGYEVRGEIRSVDLVARRGEEIIALEFKLRFSLDVVLQAIERQKSIESVYIAVPAKTEGPALRNYRRASALLKRLELGLILVHFRLSGTKVEIRFHPATYEKRRSHRERRNIIREFEGRTGDFNSGGASARKIVTAYRENAIFIACALMKLGPSSPAKLRRLGTANNTQSILSKNHYGWFERLDRGCYAIHKVGCKVVDEYPDLARHYADIVEANTSEDE